MSPILSIKNLKKSYFSSEKIEVLRGVSLEIFPQKTIAIMGSSGEGKTTLLHILAGLESFDEGLLVEGSGKNLPSISPEDRGMIFQSYNLLEDCTVLENLLFPARILRRDLSSYKERAFSLLQKVGLLDRKDSLAKILSGGEKQRIAICRALLCSPKLILADEPSGSLDHYNSTLIHQMLLKMVKEENKSLIVATHDMELANLCDKKYQLKEGLLFPLNE